MAMMLHLIVWLRRHATQWELVGDGETLQGGTRFAWEMYDKKIKREEEGIRLILNTGGPFIVFPDPPRSLCSN